MKTGKIAVILLSILIFFASCGEKKDQDEAGRLVEKDGGYSFVPPEGWEIKEVPGIKYKVARGEVKNEFAPNINVVDEQFSGTLESYVDANIEALSKLVDGYNLIGRDSFATTKGMKSVKLTMEGNQFGNSLKQNFYFFEDGTRKFVVTCTALASDYADVEPIFVESMKTFRLE